MGISPCLVGNADGGVDGHEFYQVEYRSSPAPDAFADEETLPRSAWSHIEPNRGLQTTIGCSALFSSKYQRYFRYVVAV